MYGSASGSSATPPGPGFSKYRLGCLAWKRQETPACSQNVCSQFLRPLPPPSQPAKWWILSWISIKKDLKQNCKHSAKIANKPSKKLRTNRIMNKRAFLKEDVAQELPVGGLHPPAGPVRDAPTYRAISLSQRVLQGYFLEIASQG